MRSKYSDSRRCAAAFIRFAMDHFDHDYRLDAIAYRNYFINDRNLSGFPSRKCDAVVLARACDRAARQELAQVPGLDLEAELGGAAIAAGDAREASRRGEEHDGRADPAA